MEQKQTLEYEMTTELATEIHRTLVSFALRRGWRQNLPLIICWFVFALLLAVPVFSGWWQPGVAGAVFFLATLIVLCKICASRWRAMASAHLAVAPVHMADRKVRLEFHDQRLQMETEHFRAEAAWAELVEVVVFPAFWSLSFSNGGHIVIPGSMVTPELNEVLRAKAEQAQVDISPRRTLRGLSLALGTCTLVASLAAEPGDKTPAPKLGIAGTQFTINGKPTFLVGISYYGALGASEDFIRRDLAVMKKHGVNWLRVWATWPAFDNDVSAVDKEGRPRQPFLDKLRWLVVECGKQGMIVDVTLSRGNGMVGPPRLQGIDNHRRAVETIVTALKAEPNWYLDLANERDIRDKRFVSVAELKELRQVVKRLDPTRLATASHGSDLSREQMKEDLQVIGVDFVCPHRPRTPESPGQTEGKTREYLAWMKEIARVVPLHYQEPFPRGYTAWQPVANDFLTDLRGARAGGAAGWCFHNTAERERPENRPRRSFDMREQRLFDQLDEEEHKVLIGLRDLQAERR